MKKWLTKLFKKEVRREAPWEREQRQFKEQARQQFVQLKKKGLNIPIVSL